MTHEEIIKHLERMSISFHKVDLKAINYAINQLKQAEVFDEPVEMQVCNESDFKNIHIEKVVAKLPWGFLCKDFDFDWAIWEYARPIKKEPLGFSEWAEKKENKMTLTGGIKQSIDSQVNRYINYLNQFKPF